MFLKYRTGQIKITERNKKVTYLNLNDSFNLSGPILKQIILSKYVYCIVLSYYIMFCVHVGRFHPFFDMLCRYTT